MFFEIFSNVSNKIKAKASKGKKKVWGHLFKEIIQNGKCIHCGSCYLSCDALEWSNERKQPILVGKCDGCGVCYFQCPMTQNIDIGSLGSYLNIYEAENLQLDKIGRAFQNNGVVSLLLYYLLKEENFDGAIVVKHNPNNLWHPLAVFISDIEELKQCGGTIYSHAQILEPLYDQIFKKKKKIKKIAFVGTPCNINALISNAESEFGFISHLKQEVENYKEFEIFKIGLFCMEAFDADALLDFLEGNGIMPKEISKMEISGNKLKVYTSFNANSLELLAEFPLKELENLKETSCHFCKDFSAEHADISVGNVGTPDDRNTIIIRSNKAETIINKMIEKGYLKLNKLNESNIEKIEKLAQNKKNKQSPQFVYPPKVQKDKFILHNPSEWANAYYGFTPELSQEKYVRKENEYEEIIINDPSHSNNNENGSNCSISNNNGKAANKTGHDKFSEVFIAKVPELTGLDLIPYNYNAAYDLTIKLFKNESKIKGGKILVKPNNTGFVGVFKTKALENILKKNGISNNADDQQIATQPSILKGIVDALIDLGASRVDIGENMLWDGGTPRAFYETGYTKIFSKKKYKDIVYFIDFYENDPPPSSLESVNLPSTKYCPVDFYDRCFPPKALFNEKYDYIIIASIAKTHNCSYYSLSTKNFSVSWNPRKKTGKIPPRWHIHGLPLSIFHKKYVKQALGENFKRKYKYYVREAYKYPYKNQDAKERIVKRKNRKIIISNEFTSSGLMGTIKTWGTYALDVDPHHWSGITIGIMNLGIGYLITRFTRIFAAILNQLKDVGTKVACICSAIVGQELDGPLVYGKKKYGGFAVASFDHLALEKVVLDIMFGNDNGGFRNFIINYQKSLMEELGVKHPDIIKDAENLWTLKLLQELLGGEMNNEKMKITVLNYAKNQFNFINEITPNTLYKLRQGAPFEYSKAFYVSPITWLKALHLDDELAMKAFIADKKSIEIPLIPGVVK
ncbi:MAG: Coenzyme F420 hydrogenase/dehydrogenase, beta subunit C-terminal domain [Promethearchaeota archaeon]